MGFRATRSPPPPPAALTGAACMCFFSLGSGRGRGVGGRPTVSLRGFPLWPAPSGGPSCHVAASPPGFPLSWWGLLKSAPTWPAQNRRVPFKDSQIEGQKLISTKFHSFPVPLEDARGARFRVLATFSDSFSLLALYAPPSPLPPKGPRVPQLCGQP